MGVNTHANYESSHFHSFREKSNVREKFTTGRPDGQTLIITQSFLYALLKKGVYYSFTCGGRRNFVSA